MKRFFDNLPREIFEAARVDGAGPFRLFWSIVLPMSRPILGVVSVFAVIATWKDYLWPLLVLRDPDIQPLSVRLPILAPTTDLGVFIAALTISSIIPIALFLLFQRLFLQGERRERGAEGLDRRRSGRASCPLARRLSSPAFAGLGGGPPWPGCRRSPCCTSAGGRSARCRRRPSGTCRCRRSGSARGARPSARARADRPGGRGRRRSGRRHGGGRRCTPSGAGMSSMTWRAWSAR